MLEQQHHANMRLKILEKKHEILKLSSQLKEIYQECIKRAEVPEKWKFLHVTTKYENGDKTNCNNYRGIGVISSKVGCMVRCSRTSWFQSRQINCGSCFHACSIN